MIIIMLILMLLSAFFSASETAFACVNKIRLRHQADKGDKRSARALRVAERYENALTAILIGNNIANIGSSSLATVLFTQYFGDAGAAISTVVMTILVLTFCEVLPKSYAKSHADNLAMAFAAALNGLILIFTPFVKFFDMLSSLFKSTSDTPSITEDELMYIIDEIEEEGVLEEQESDLVISALKFDEKTVNEILIPRVKVVGIPCDASLDQIRDLFLSSHYSRFPVYDKTLDNIIGIITNKEFFRLIHGSYKSLDDIIQDAIYIPSTKRISEILHDMQTSKSHMAVVVDQYGGTKGIVTLEDVLEELVGDIYDESDEIPTEFVKTAPHTYTVEGAFSISDMRDGLDEEDIPNELPETFSTSVGGWVTELLGCIPSEGETAEWERFHFTVLEADNLAVSKVQLIVDPLPHPDEDDE